MARITPVVIDFETFPAQPRPDYPPDPVGVSVKLPGKKARYWAWGHPEGNNCTKDEAGTILKDVLKNHHILVHHGNFDVAIIAEKFGLSFPAWDRIHDTLPMLFVINPHARSYALKDNALSILGIIAEEQNQLAEWLLTHQPVPLTKLTRKTKGFPSKFAAYAPAKLVGEYANADCKMTLAIWKWGMSRVSIPAYDRERKLLPIIWKMEQRGVKIDEDLLRKDIVTYTDVFEKIDLWLEKKLKSPGINFNSGQQLAYALINAGYTTENRLGITKTGKLQTNAESLAEAVDDQQLLSTMRYRAQLKTFLGTFMRPWAETAEASRKGLIFTRWNSTRQEGGGGARTGRLSSTPNFQNIPKEHGGHWKDRTKEGRSRPSPPFRGLPGLPLVRRYIVASRASEVLLNRDYSQQELRILAHFEDGPLKEAYLKDSWLDVHEHARKLIAEMIGVTYTRKQTKNTGFAMLYGQGVAGLARKNEIVYNEAKQLRDAYLNEFPGIRELYKICRLRAKNDEPIWTWGDRPYSCEPPKIIKGILKTFEYKMVNVLIQGSAGDCTKEAMITYDEASPESDTLLLTVHDELMVSAPKKRIHPAMKILREAMESVAFDVPMLSEGSVGDNWAELKAYDQKGLRV